MATTLDIATTRIVRQEFCRRHIDTSLTDIKVFSGIVYIRGKIKSFNNKLLPPEQQISNITRSLRSKPEIRDVIVELAY